MCIHCLLSFLERTDSKMVKFLAKDDFTVAQRILTEIPNSETPITDDLLIKIDELLFKLGYSKKFKCYQNVYESLAFLVDRDMLLIQNNGTICKAEKTFAIH